MSDGAQPDSGVEAPQGSLGGAAGWLRFAVRAPIVLAGTLGIWVLWLVGLPVALAAGRRGPWRDQIVHLWGRFVVRCLAVRVTRRGEPPAGGFFLVANHLSYLDIPLLASQMPTNFVSKAEIAHWPVIGWLAQTVGVVFLRREDKRDLLRVSTEIERELEAGNGVVLFPEGTSSKGEVVLPFRPSLLAPAARGGLSVSYAAISYRTPAGCPPASTVVCWWGGMTFAGHILDLLRLPSIHATVNFGDAPIREADRKDLAQRLWEAVQARFEPVK